MMSMAYLTFIAADAAGLSGLMAVTFAIFTQTVIQAEQ
jgi:hypothetical protein